LKSTGNDIVALASVDKHRTLQFGFYSKILSISEQEQYPKSGFLPLPFELYVWLLWSVKESAYKFLKRNDPGLVFSPIRTVVKNLEFPLMPVSTSAETIQWESNGNEDEVYKGKVMYGNQILYFRSKISESWIATVVSESGNFENVQWGVGSIADISHEQQSKAVRALLLSKLSSFIPGNLQASKSPTGYPVVLKDGKELTLPVSFAHHHRFVAFSFVADAVDAGQLA
jgi:phosphopantetheinyl transferase (holo-ACP synthase)